MIGEVECMKIGFIVAMENEYAPFLSSLGDCIATDVLCGMEFSTYAFAEKQIVLAKCGIGEIAAASATALCIGNFGCDYIVNFGLVGSLGNHALSTCVRVKDVVHYDCDLTAFGQPLGQPADRKEVYFPADDQPISDALSTLPAVRLASGDKFISDTALKNNLVSVFSADICDMEGAGIAITCARSGVPFTMIKLVSDSADDVAAQTFSLSKTQAFGTAVDVVLSLLKR